jgi:hypothetical protein
MSRIPKREAEDPEDRGTLTNRAGKEQTAGRCLEKTMDRTSERRFSVDDHFFPTRPGGRRFASLSKQTSSVWLQRFCF